MNEELINADAKIQKYERDGEFHEKGTEVVQK